LRRILSSLLLLTLAACAPTVIEGDPEGVVIENKSTTGIGIVGVEVGYFSERARQLAVEAADRHCEKFGKRARLVARDRNVLQFECYGDAPAGGTGAKG